MNQRVLIGLTVLVFGVVGVFSGIAYGRKTFEPQVEYVEVPEIRTVDQYITEIKEVVVEKEVIVEKEIIVEKTAELREFASLEELEEWLANDTTNALHLIFGGEEGLIINPSFEDCDDYAYALQKAAERDGFRISVQIDTRGQHALNSVFIGNNVYFIEPQTDEVWLEAYRDKVEEGK